MVRTRGAGRKRAGEQLGRLRQQLEERVQERTAELKAANERLQHEIAERKRAEEEFRKERDFSNSLIANARTIILVLDTQGRIISFNPYMADICGYKPEEVQGRDWFETFIPPEERDRAGGVFKETKSENRTQGVIHFIVAKDGQRREIEWYNEALKDADGHLTGILAVGQDITERRQAEKQIAIFQKFAEASGQGFAMAELDGNLIYVNPTLCRILGEERMEDVFHKPFHAYYSEETQQRLRDDILPTVTERGQWSGELALISRNGESTPTIQNFFLIRDENGEPLYLADVITDLTERKKAEEALRMSQAQLLQSEKMASIGQLAAGVAHEINNPAGFVMSNISSLTEYVGTFKKVLNEYESLSEQVRATNGGAHEDVLVRIDEIRQEEDLSYVLKDVDNLLAESFDGTRRISEIVQNLKSFARVDETALKEANINDGIEATLKIVWNELKYKCGVQKKLGDVPDIRCNPGKLNQVFMNLLVNAAQAIEERGEITIETQADDGFVVARISDTGRGIPPEQLSRIFDPFFTTKRVGEGTGLGLSISHGIIREHHGSIEVESEVGKGTTFTIRLPVDGVGS